MALPQQVGKGTRVGRVHRGAESGNSEFKVLNAELGIRTSPGFLRIAVPILQESHTTVVDVSMVTACFLGSCLLRG